MKHAVDTMTQRQELLWLFYCDHPVPGDFRWKFSRSKFGYYLDPRTMVLKPSHSDGPNRDVPSRRAQLMRMVGKSWLPHRSRWVRWPNFFIHAVCVLTTSRALTWSLKRILQKSVASNSQETKCFACKRWTVAVTCNYGVAAITVLHCTLKQLRMANQSTR